MAFAATISACVEIKPAGDTDDCAFESGRVQTLHQAVYLDVINFAAALVPTYLVRWNIGKAVDAPLKGDLTRRHLELERDAAHGGDALTVKRGTVIEARHPHAVLAQALQIDISDDQLRAICEALCLGETLTVFVDQALPVPGEVGGGFPKASRRIDIGGDALARLARAEHPPVLGLADGDVTGRQVHEHKRAGERSVAAGRERRPEILANLDVHGEVWPILGEDNQIAAEGDRFASHPNDRCARFAARGELPLLVELPIVGKIGLGHRAENAAAIDKNGAIEQLGFRLDRRAHYEHRLQLPARTYKLCDRLLRRRKQSILKEEIVIGVGRQPKLRKDGERRIAR